MPINASSSRAAREQRGRRGERTRFQPPVLDGPGGPLRPGSPAAARVQIDTRVRTPITGQAGRLSAQLLGRFGFRLGGRQPRPALEPSGEARWEDAPGGHVARPSAPLLGHAAPGLERTRSGLPFSTNPATAVDGFPVAGWYERARPRARRLRLASRLLGRHPTRGGGRSGTGSLGRSQGFTNSGVFLHPSERSDCG
jgi:hypothetical protein